MRPFFPVRPHVDALAAALPAFVAALERRHFGVGRVGRHVDQRLVTAGVVVALTDEVMHAQLAHVTAHHRWAGMLTLLWLGIFRSMNQLVSWNRRRFPLGHGPFANHTFCKTAGDLTTLRKRHRIQCAAMGTKEIFPV